MGWTEIHNATQAAIMSASGLDSQHVIWKYGNGNQPTDPYVALSFTISKTVGRDFLVTKTIPSNPVETRIRQRLHGTREVGLQIEAFNGNLYAVTGDAMDLAERTKAALSMPNVMAQLAAVELSTFDPGDIQNIPAVENAKFRGRALCMVRCYVPAPLLETFTTFVEKFRMKATILGGHDGDPVVRAFASPDDAYWSSATAYATRAVVKYLVGDQMRYYRAKQASTNQVPTNTTYWELLLP